MPADLVQRLYTAPPEGFVGARTEAVAAARAAGDEATARQLAKLRKPTVAAWLVNLLAIRRPELVADLVELAAELRAAQRDLRGPRLRELSAQRRGTVAALVAEARALGVEADPRLGAGKLPLAEVEATLQAALADVEVAEQVRSGRLVRAASYAGFGEVPRPQLRLVTGGAEVLLPEPAASGPTATRTAGGVSGQRGAGSPAEQAATRKATAREEAAEEAAARRAAAERSELRRTLARELTGARTRQRRAESELERATAAERAAGSALSEAEAALAEAERRRAAAEQEVSRRKLARKSAERDLAAARRRTGDVQAAVEALDAE
ncbi:hypothetical protein BDK92_2895 [Micromonospora pisi]|uniref:Uncharacterized protein n=1 Tax=Micromonospora pisi TaxID=589240 RepID=A0A495JI32_9ACTN|nr:hypothetical protein [Micromonospora pisi]RKR88567.1 hypothetical protein BDK92_2895 [Micromonospora pisi]